MGYEETVILDKVIAAALIPLMVLGVLGNGLAVRYFWERRNKTIHDNLYLSITVVDFVTSSFIFPIIATLFGRRADEENGTQKIHLLYENTIQDLNYRHRYSIFFSNQLFCTSWGIIVFFTTAMSMYLATTICVTRSLAITRPQRPVNKKVVRLIVAGCSVYLITSSIIYLFLKWATVEFYNDCGICIMVFSAIPDTITTVRNTITLRAFIILGSLIVGLLAPGFITFVFFAITICFLMKHRNMCTNDERKFMRASISISLFTALFLICNTPCFMYILSHMSWFDDSDFVAFLEKFRGYNTLLCYIFPIILNAALNPVLYVLRMKRFRKWVTLLVRFRGFNIHPTT